MNSITLRSDRALPFASSILLSLFQIGLFTAITALAAQIRIPLPGTPVPVTLQSMAVILAGAYLGSFRGALSQVFLIALGALGFMVFSLPVPGSVVLLGPTGGYILGFVFAAFIAGKILERNRKLSFLKLNLLLFVASLFIFVPGVIWLSVFTGKNLWIALQLGFFPFIVGDILKTLAASLLIKGLGR